MLIDLNTLPKGGEDGPDLNKIHVEHEEDQDVVAADEVGEADYFGLHPEQNDEQPEIRQGKHICLNPKLSELVHLPKIRMLVYFSVLKSEATSCYLVITTIF
jgi:hypothetical protein